MIKKKKKEKAVHIALIRVVACHLSALTIHHFLYVFDCSWNTRLLNYETQYNLLKLNKR
jgi:hypothetical protein